MSGALLTQRMRVSEPLSRFDPDVGLGEIAVLGPQLGSPD
jgi:hypothetical protein